MKTIGLEHTTLAACVKDARYERVLLTHKGKPVALVVGVEGLDEEQLQLGSSNAFWTLIEGRRKQQTISRAELEQRATDMSESREAAPKKQETKARRVTPNTYEASVVKRTNECTTGAGWPSVEQIVKHLRQAIAAVLISVAGHST